MKQEIEQLHDKNVQLQKNIDNLLKGNNSLQQNLDNLGGENSTLKAKIQEMSLAIDSLQKDEQEIKDQVAKLTAKIQEGIDQELKDQINKLEQLYKATNTEIVNLVNRLNSLESGQKQPPASGIFSYIDEEDDQLLFMEKIDEALAQEMTYAQIDDYLTKNLPGDLDKIIKDHPALTKNYIRDLRKE